MKKNIKKLIISTVLTLAFVLSLAGITAFAEEAAEPEPKQVSISFDTKSDDTCEPIHGYAGQTKITPEMLPVPRKYGYKFTEWRHFNEYGVPFELTVFPNFDITLVACYEPNGFEVTFEEGISEIFDYNSGIELIAPGTKNYSQKMVQEGWRCLKTKGGIGSPEFLLSYDYKLEAGKEYEIILWLKSDKALSGASLDFLYSDIPDVRAKPLGYTKALDLQDMKAGEWCEYKFKFVAAAPYIIVRLPDKEGLLIDNIKAECTGITGNPAELKAVKGSFSIITYIIVAVGLITLVCIALFWPKMKRKIKG